jgi:hypothetical protein
VKSLQTTNDRQRTSSDGNNSPGQGPGELIIGINRPKEKFSRWLLLLKIEISSIVHCCFSISQNELKLYLQLHGNEYFNINAEVFCEICRTIPAKFAIIWYSGYRVDNLNVIFC